MDYIQVTPELLNTLVEDRVAKVLADLVAKHRGGTLTPDAAMCGIASISSLRYLPGDFRQRIKTVK